MPPGWKKNMLRGDIWWKAVSRMARRTITSFCKTGKGDRAVNVLNWLLVAAGLFMAFIGYACIVVGARSERDDWEERK